MLLDNNFDVSHTYFRPVSDDNRPLLIIHLSKRLRLLTRVLEDPGNKACAKSPTSILHGSDVWLVSNTMLWLAKARLCPYVHCVIEDRDAIVSDEVKELAPRNT